MSGREATLDAAAPADDAEDVLSMPWPTASGPIERYPLAALAGARPARPDWFEEALAEAPERTRFSHDGVELELLIWGEVGKPGLLFLHGDAAHAGWWDFVVPYFAKDYRCAALSFGGMGRSGHRDAYSFETFAAEAIAALPAAGLDKGPVRPIIVAHSLGSYPAMIVATECSDIAALVVIDPVIDHSRPRAPGQAVGRSTKPHRIQPTLADALARFRFIPPHAEERLYVIDHVARGSIVEADGGWRWSSDHRLWETLQMGGSHGLAAKVRAPLAYISGELSLFSAGPARAKVEAALPPGSPVLTVPGAGHHIMIDQPRALADALRALLSGWPREWKDAGATMAPSP